MTEPWDMHDPRRRHSSTPVVDEYSETVLRDAIHSLTMLRSPDRHFGDARLRFSDAQVTTRHTV